MERPCLLVDTDPGLDDALALLLALRSAEVRAVTTVGGNARLAETTRNALALLDAFGAPEVPVAKGADRPLAGRFEPAYAFHGPGGLPRPLPPPRRRPLPLSAPDLLARTALERPGRCVLVALGPLTNPARALRRWPALRTALARLVVMGGAVGVPGNVTPWAEFNLYSDPLAARLVLDSGLPLTLVGLNVTERVCLTRRDLPRFQEGDPAVRRMGDLLAAWFRLHPGRERFPLHDPLAVGVALRPDLVRTQALRVRVVTAEEDPARRGQTVAEGPGPVRVAVEVEEEAFFRWFWGTLGLPA